jgi:hypothetical protein
MGVEVDIRRLLGEAPGRYMTIGRASPCLGRGGSVACEEPLEGRTRNHDPAAETDGWDLPAGDRLVRADSPDTKESSRLLDANGLSLVSFLPEVLCFVLVRPMMPC